MINGTESEISTPSVSCQTTTCSLLNHKTHSNSSSSNKNSSRSSSPKTKPHTSSRSRSNSPYTSGRTRELQQHNNGTINPSSRRSSVNHPELSQGKLV